MAASLSWWKLWRGTVLADMGDFQQQLLSDIDVSRKKKNETMLSWLLLT